MEPSLIYQDMARNRRPHGERTMHYRSRDQFGVQDAGEITYWLKDDNGGEDPQPRTPKRHSHREERQRHYHQHAHQHQSFNHYHHEQPQYHQHNHFHSHSRPDEARHRRELDRVGRENLQRGQQQAALHAQQYYQHGERNGYARLEAEQADRDKATWWDGYKEAREHWGPDVQNMQRERQKQEERDKAKWWEGYKEAREHWGPDVSAMQREREEQRQQDHLQRSRSQARPRHRSQSRQELRPRQPSRPAQSRRNSVHGNGYVDHGYVFQGYDEPEAVDSLSGSMGRMRLEGHDRRMTRRQSMHMAERPRPLQGHGSSYGSRGQSQIGGPRLGERGMLGPTWDDQWYGY